MVSSRTDLAAALADAESRYRARRPLSAQRHLAAAAHMPGGNTRSVLHYDPFPICFARGRGNRLTDVDGLGYLDLLGDYSAGLYGHSDPVIRAAVGRALEDGTALGGPNRYEAALAEALCARFPSVELVRFTNSGTEANLMALSTVRALRPGRTRILVFDGGYHGGVFSFRGRDPMLNAPFEWVVAGYNEIDATRATLRAHGAALAAVLVEPMLGGGCIPAAPGFLAMLREECTAHDIVLIFDEVMTSRLSPSGLQGLYRIRPDMTTFGKYLGAGSSCGAFGGRRALMQRFDPRRSDGLEHAGTFNNNVLSMAGGLAGLTQVFTPAEALRINSLGDGLRERLNAVARARCAPFQATGVGSLIGLQLGAAQSLLHLELIERGYFIGRRGYVSLSLPTTAQDCDDFAAAVDDVLATHGALLEAAPA